MRKKFNLLLAGILLFPASLLAQVDASITQGNAPTQEPINPDMLFSYIGFGVIMIFIFLVILALARSIGALSKMMGEKYSGGHQVNS